MLVKIDPADVVSVPHDCECQKLRTCRYEVVSELEERKPLKDCYLDEYGTKEEDLVPMQEWADGGLDYAESEDNAAKLEGLSAAYQDGYNAAMSKFHNKRDASGKFCK